MNEEGCMVSADPFALLNKSRSRTVDIDRSQNRYTRRLEACNGDG
jgi:hypothetical protein